MKHMRITVIALIAIALLLITAGCTQPAGTTGTTTVAPTASAAPIKELRIGYQPSTHQMAHFTAMNKGMWQQDLAPLGVQNVTEYVFPTGAPEMAAMLAGNIDVAYVGAAPVLSALSSGLDAKIVGAAQTQGTDLVVRTGVNYTSPQSLKGMKIATYQAGTIQDTILRNWLKQNNISPDKDVEIVGMGPGDAITALTASKVDAVFLPDPSPAIILGQGTGRTVFQSGQMYPNHTCCVLVVSGKLIREHPEIVEQILRTHQKATEYNLKNSDEAAAIYAQKTGSKLEDIKTSLKIWDGKWVSDPNLIVDPVLDYAKIQYDLKYIKMPLTKDQIFDLSFFKKISR
ncbi:MAG: ABC transporter substrate-binding protein, partial [Methanomicrobiales archaeon]